MFKGKHAFWFVLLGWAIALILPPQMVFGMFRGAQ